MIETARRVTPRASAKESKSAAPSSPTSAQAWRKKVCLEEVIVLPSGVSVKIKRMTLFDMAIVGHIPMPVVSGVFKKFARFEGATSNDQVAKALDGVSEGDLTKARELFERVAVLVCLDPKVARDSVDDKAMNVKDIEMEDLLTIFSSSVKGGFRGLIPFR